MIRTPRRNPHAYIPRWRSRSAREALYQLAFLALVGWGLYSMFSNALANLRARGIRAGFAFLYNTDSLFVISETVPLPVPQGGALYFLIAVTGGVGGTWLLSRWARAHRKRLADDNLLVTLAIGLLVIIPGLVLYTTGHAIRSVEYAVPSTYGMGMLTGLMNTLKLAVFCLLLGTLVGLIIGIARLSGNWLVRMLAGVFIEVTRNIPLLLQVFFWYFAVLRALPPVRSSIRLGRLLILNNRGVVLPHPVPQAAFPPFLASVGVAGILIYYYARYARRHQGRTGKVLPVIWPALCMLIGLPALSVLAVGEPVSFTFAQLRGFNYFGGLSLSPEFTAMLISLALYSGGFIAEIVRSGIQAIPRGQTEAARSVGLSRGRVLQLVILPQARRIIIPPLTANWLGTIKDTSLGVAIGYPELVAVGGTILDVSGHAMEIIGLTMFFYMLSTLLVSLFMNWYNARVQLKV
jgi:general L-amino acid transport system permease protein